MVPVAGNDVFTAQLFHAAEIFTHPELATLHIQVVCQRQISISRRRFARVSGLVHRAAPRSMRACFSEGRASAVLSRMAMRSYVWPRIDAARVTDSPSRRLHRRPVPARSGYSVGSACAFANFLRTG
jgi:hypothetical protein